MIGVDDLNTKIIKFDLNKSLYDTLLAKQGDTKSRFLLFQLLDRSIPFDLENRSVRAYMIKPDGTEVFNDLIINNYKLGYCTLELTNQVLAVPGIVKVELMITEEDRKLTSFVFELKVIKSINSEESIVSTNEFTALLNGLASLSEYDNYKNEIKNARGGESNLSARLNNFDSQLDKNKNEEKGLTYLSTTVFKQNVDFSSKYFRIPFGCVTKNGVIIAGCDVRYQGSNDQSYIDIGIGRSLNGGKTWQDKKIAMRNNNVNPNYSRVMDGTILYDEDINRIYLLGNYWNNGTGNWTYSNTHKDSDWDIKLCYSDDEGLSWSEPISLRDLCPSTVSQFIGGVGSGIKTSNGTLIFPIQLAKLNDSPYNVQSGLMYSNDGVNWTISESYVPAYTSECNVFEYRGEIYINCRQEGSNKRAIYKTSNLGSTWTYCSLSDNTPQPNACMGSTIKIHTDYNLEDLILFSCVNTSTRGNLTLKVMNYDDTAFNNVVNYYNKNSDGYSCLMYDKWNKKLYSVFEIQGSLQFTDLTPSLQHCYLRKSEDSNIDGAISTEITVNINDNSILTFDKLPSLINNKYKKVIINLDGYTGKCVISNIHAQVELTCSSDTLILNNFYVRNCLSVKTMKNVSITTSFSTDHVIALENTNLFSAPNTSWNIEDSAQSTTFVYLSNSNIKISPLNFNHTTKIVTHLVEPREGGGNVILNINNKPSGDLSFIKNFDNSLCDIYVRDSYNKVNEDGSIRLIDVRSGSDVLSYTVTYNSYINGVTNVNSNITILDDNNKIQSLINKSIVICAPWRFRTTSEISSGTLLFNLPLALRPFLTKILTCTSFNSSTGATSVSIRIGVDGNVIAYGDIPSGVEVVCDGQYPLF